MLYCSMQNECEDRSPKECGKCRRDFYLTLIICGIFLSVAIYLIGEYAIAGEPGSRHTILRVIDGDTIMTFDGIKENRVRMIGVEAPETRRDAKSKRNADYLGVSVNVIVEAGKQAKRLVESFSPPGTVITLEYCEDTIDQYGRTLAYIRLANGRVLNEFVIENGAARSTPQYKHRDSMKYDELERRARSERRGFWKTIWSKERERK